MKKNLVLSFLCLLILGFACSKKEDEKSTKVRIRIHNASSFNYEAVTVNIDGSPRNYGNIASKQYSDYKEFDYAYRYAQINLLIDGETFTIQPIDFVGENKLDAGNYTYQIDAQPTGDQYERLSLALIKD